MSSAENLPSKFYLLSLKARLLEYIGRSDFLHFVAEVVRQNAGLDFVAYSISSPLGDIDVIRYDLGFALEAGVHETIHREKLILKHSISDCVDSLSIKNFEGSALYSMLFRAVKCHHLLLEYRASLIDQGVLSEREKEIFNHLANGLSNQEMASKCGVSVRTIEKHCENIYTKLGVENRFAIISLAAKMSA